MIPYKVQISPSMPPDPSPLGVQGSVFPQLKLQDVLSSSWFGSLLESSMETKNQADKVQKKNHKNFKG